MPTTELREQPNETEEHTPESLVVLIGEQVSRKLGAPGDLLKLQVRRLWENRYRVNVFVGADITSAKVANSYFVVGDTAGNIVESTPPITKQY